MTRKYPKIPRNDVIQLIAKARLNNCSLQEIEDYVEESLVGRSSEQIYAILISSLHYFYAGYTNGFLSDIYFVLTGKRVEVIGEVKALYPCDCCGRLSLTEKIGIDDGGWDICPYCNWEDTGITQGHCGCNHGSIEEYCQHIADNPNFYYREMYLKQSDLPNKGANQ